MPFENHHIYDIKKLTFSNFLNEKLDFKKLKDGNFAGFIIEEFLTDIECDTILTGYNSLENHHKVKINPSFYSFPISFAQYTQMLTSKELTDEDYSLKSKSFLDSFEEMFGVTVFAKLQSIFSEMVNSPTIKLAPHSLPNTNYIPFTFRELLEGDGCLKAHCENLFLNEFQDFFTKVNAFSTQENQLSFFIILQAPNEGGELTLYDLIWKNGQQRINDHQVKINNEITLDFDNLNSVKCNKYSPSKGSLVVFRGGDIWHRVEKVKKSPSRITLGGFLSFSHDNKTLYAWS